MTVSPGTRLGAFEILASLGAGGMGEVYRARDTRLGREVALKVLPAELSEDPERRARFEQEARSASALNHPNIVTVHDIGTADSAYYIAMELVDGKTLRDLLASGPFPIRRLLAVAQQVADGLAKAHASGIVHRDLKPENVMVNKDGFVKILDFGLAKLASPVADAGSQLATLVETGTRPGMVLGTVGYMSPEQASGEAVDFRSDQFSLGSILYEMATGKRAFQKKTPVETLSAIIRDEPEAIGTSSPTAPAPLRWIVERCLAKEPEDRYASTRDLGRDLKQTLAHLSEASAEAPDVARPKRRIPAWGLAATALLLGLAGLAAGWRLGARRAAAETRPPATWKRVTFGPGLEDEPSFSPDGKFLAYTTDESGNLDVVVLPLAGGEPIRVAATEADESQPAWSPDGSKIAFVSARDHGGRLGIALNISALEPYVNANLGDIFLVPALGGVPVKLVEDGYYPAWSPDGKRIAFMSRRAGQFDLWIVPADGGAATRLTEDANFDFQPQWSPDGQTIAYGSGPVNGGPFNVSVVAASGGAPTALTKDFGYVTKPAWSADGKTIFFSGERNGILNAWRIPFSKGSGPGPLVRLTLGQGQDANISVSQDGRRLALATVQNESQIWELTIESSALRAVTSGAGGADFAQLSPDGKTFLVQSNRSGDPAAWSVDLAGRFLSQLTANQLRSPEPRWSPDGRRFAYTRNDRLFIQTIGSMEAQDTGVVCSTKSWSPDGRSIAVGYYSAEQPTEIVVYSIESGKARTITSLKTSTDYPDWSPGGKWIVFQTQRGSVRELWVVPAAGGEARQLTRDSEDSHPVWSPNNPDEVLFLREHKRLAVLSVSTGAVRFLPGYSEGSYILDYGSWSPDGKRVFFTVMRKSGDIYVLEGF